MCWQRQILWEMLGNLLAFLKGDPNFFLFFEGGFDFFPFSLSFFSKTQFFLLGVEFLNSTLLESG